MFWADYISPQFPSMQSKITIIIIRVEYEQFSNFAKNSPDVMFKWNKCLIHHFRGLLAGKSGLFCCLRASKVPFFAPEIAKSVCFWNGAIAQIEGLKSSNGCFGLVINNGSSGCKVAMSQKKWFWFFCDILITMMISSSRLDQFPSIQSRNSILSPTPLHFKVKISAS